MASIVHSFKSIQWFEPAARMIVRELYCEELERDWFPIELRDLAANLKPGERLEIGSEALASIWPLLEDASLHDLPARMICEASDLPYRRHSGREYDLMRRGVKPLAAFPYPRPSSPFSMFLETYFKKSVDLGLLSAELIYDVDEDGKRNDVTDCLYAQPAEIWRFDVYRLMKSISRRTRWNDSLEFMEGYLLGYSADQNNMWYDFRKKMGLKFGVQLMYALLEPSEVDRLKNAGCKAFVDTLGDHIRLFMPHSGSEPSDAEAALLTLSPVLAKLYAPQLRTLDYYEQSTTIKNIKFEVYNFPTGRRSELNMIIDGIIEIIERRDD